MHGIFFTGMHPFILLPLVVAAFRSQLFAPHSLFLRCNTPSFHRSKTDGPFLQGALLELTSFPMVCHATMLQCGRSDGLRIALDAIARFRFPPDLQPPGVGKTRNPRGKATNRISRRTANYVPDRHR